MESLTKYRSDTVEGRYMKTYDDICAQYVREEITEREIFVAKLQAQFFGGDGRRHHIYQARDVAAFLHGNNPISYHHACLMKEYYETHSS